MNTLLMDINVYEKLENNPLTRINNNFNKKIKVLCNQNEELIKKI